MGRPLNKKLFGPDLGGDGFQIIGTGFFAGAPTACHIIKQKGSKRFVISDGITEHVAVLNDGAPAQEGEFQLVVNGGDSVAKITAHRVVSFAGEVFAWSDIALASSDPTVLVDADLGGDLDDF